MSLTNSATSRTTKKASSTTLSNSTGLPAPSDSNVSSIATPTDTDTFIPPTIALPTGSGGGPGGQSSPEQQSLQTSANLYLYTFLATLVLLLGVSAAIVVRSLLLRRRHRRMIEDAIRNGTWTPHLQGGAGGGAGGRRGVDLSKKPKMFEVHLGLPDGGVVPMAENEKGKVSVQPSLGHPLSSEHHEWDAIVPFAVANTVASPSPSTNASATNLSNAGASNVSIPPPPQSSGLFSILMGRFIPGLGAAQPTTSSPSTNNAATSGSASDSPDPSSIPLAPLKGKSLIASSSSSPGPVQVAVLIAMPSQTPLSYVLEEAKRKGTEEEELPYIEVGVTVVDVVEGKHDDKDITRSSEDTEIEADNGQLLTGGANAQSIGAPHDHAGALPVPAATSS